MTRDDALRVIIAALDAATTRVGDPIIDVSKNYDAIFVRLEDDTEWRLTVDRAT